MTRTVIIGAPRTGKTTLAVELVGRTTTRVRHTDDLIGVLDWSAASRKIADQWLTEAGPWIIEGVAAVRGLRKWLRANPTGSPCDTIIVCSHPKVARTEGQGRMAKGHDKIWREIRGELEARGVAIEAVIWIALAWLALARAVSTADQPHTSRVAAVARRAVRESSMTRARAVMATAAPEPLGPCPRDHAEPGTKPPC